METLMYTPRDIIITKNAQKNEGRLFEDFKNVYNKCIKNVYKCSSN